VLSADSSNPEFLAGSQFVDDLDHISDCFDRTTKPRFRNSLDPQYVKFGSARDNDLDYGIRFGQLKLTRYAHVSVTFATTQSQLFNLRSTDIAGFFQPSIDCVVQAVEDQRNSAKEKTSVSIFPFHFSKRGIDLRVARCPCRRLRS